MTDSRIINYILDMDCNTEAWKIYDRIIKRQLYKHCGTIITRINPFKPIIHKKISIKEICKRSNDVISPDDVIMFETKIGYISGNKKNPLTNIYLYEKNDSEKKIKLILDDVASLTDGAFQEADIFYFCKNPEKAVIVKNIINTYKEELMKNRSK